MSSMRDGHVQLFDAVEQSDGSYLLNDAWLYWYNEEGEVHREDGPSVIAPRRGDVYWYINDLQYTFDEWCIQLNKSDEDKMLLRLQYG